MKIKSENVKKIFYLILLGSLLIFLISIPITHYESLRLYLWKEGSSFYDFFISLKGNVYWNRAQRYINGDLYPPLANLFYMLITRCMSIDSLRALQEWKGGLTSAKALQDCSIYFVIYMNVLLLFYYIVVTSWKKGSWLEKNIFTLSMLFSVPFLYQFERANLIFLVLVLTMVFFLWKDSPNRVLKEISYLSLAAAAGMKLYPAIFGALLLKEKKYKDACRLIVYGIVAAVLPFVCFGGIQDGLTNIGANIAREAGKFTMTRIGCQLNYTIILKNILYWTGGDKEFWSRSIMVIMVLLGIWAIWELKTKWKIILLMSCMAIGIPSISYIYTAIFMILPIIAFLDSGEKSKWDMVYMAGMLLVIIPLPFCWMEGAGDKYYSYMHVTTPTLVEGTSIIVMTVLLTVEGLTEFFSRSKRKILGVSAIILAFAAGFVLNQSKYGAPYAYTNYLTKTLSQSISAQNGDEIIQSFTAHGTGIESVILKINPLDQGKMYISVETVEEDKIVEAFSLDMDEMKNGYNQIDFDNCILDPGEQYILRLKFETENEDSVKISRTIEYLNTGNEFFAKNEEKLDGALAVQIIEER